MDWIDFLQWPAMVVTVAAAWLVAARSRRKRSVGFWVFLASNVLWTVWGWHTGAYALIVLQAALAAMNIRGVYKNDPDLESGPELRSVLPK
ncbi:MAG TPA: hypothetical protein VED01_18500 [Burkholderiales bacterium]|nr:hypothetical protein [Burkholderiales bacterium]